jgi:hypothetical protein
MHLRNYRSLRPKRMPIPVVIGSGLTGLSISHSLSRASIDHVLIGRRPDTSPRLGESMNLEGTLLLWEMFPQLSRFFFPKAQVLGYLAAHEVVCDFDVGKRFVSRMIFRAMGFAPAEEFLQVDRIGFDAALWDLTTASEHCTVLDAKVENLELDAASDRFTGVRLVGRYGARAVVRLRCLEPRASARADREAGLSHAGRPAARRLHALSPASRALRTASRIGSAPPPSCACSPRATGWRRSPWCIPLGDYVSVGVSMSADESALSDEELLARTATAFARYGIDYRRRFSRSAEIKGLHHNYFVYDRAYGANWLLAGPSFCQVWWMASSGVGTALSAAKLAPKLLDDPARWGPSTIAT